MKKMIILLTLLGIILLFCNCSFNTIENNKEKSVRLAENYNANWAIEAIGELNDKNINYIPKIAVIDTAVTIVRSEIKKYGIMKDSTEVYKTYTHGDFVISKILENNRNVEIYAIEVTKTEEKIYEEDFYSAICKALEFDVDIINISIGTETNYNKIEDIVEKCINLGIIVVASAGNNGNDLMYPAKYEGVISVMARDINNRDLGFNGKNNNKRSFSAPGEHIICDNNEYITGSSIATPFITSAIARIFNVCKNKIKYEDIIEILKDSCLYPTNYSYGIVSYVELEKILK